MSTAARYLSDLSEFFNSPVFAVHSLAWHNQLAQTPLSTPSVKCARPARFYITVTRLLIYWLYIVTDSLFYQPNMAEMRLILPTFLNNCLMIIFLPRLLLRCLLCLHILMHML